LTPQLLLWAFCISASVGGPFVFDRVLNMPPLLNMLLSFAAAVAATLAISRSLGFLPSGDAQDGLVVMFIAIVSGVAVILTVGLVRGLRADG
jgi:hypothetical protein